MKNIKKIAAVGIVGLLGLGGLTACTQADKVSQNVSNDADNFKVRRRVVVINTRTDKIELSAEGLISVDIDDKQLDIIAKIGKNKYKKDIVNLTGNNMYTLTQLENSNVDPYKYEITWLPKSIVPVKVVGEKQ